VLLWNGTPAASLTESVRRLSESRTGVEVVFLSGDPAFCINLKQVGYSSLSKRRPPIQKG
jgi:hypothetical protein